MARWLVKTEPETYSFEQLVKDQQTCWDHVRNYTARNNLMAMKAGEQAFVYHSVGPKAIVGICEITREHYPDPSAVADGEPADRWVAVDVKPVRALPQPVTLAQLKASKSLSKMQVVTMSRLSVTPVTEPQWKAILRLAGEGA
jgi:predicted RNA-binding protein with PUA-like domain